MSVCPGAHVSRCHVCGFIDRHISGLTHFLLEWVVYMFESLLTKFCHYAYCITPLLMSCYVSTHLFCTSSLLPGIFVTVIAHPITYNIWHQM